MYTYMCVCMYAYSVEEQSRRDRNINTVLTRRIRGTQWLRVQSHNRNHNYLSVAPTLNPSRSRNRNRNRTLLVNRNVIAGFVLSRAYERQTAASASPSRPDAHRRRTIAR